MTAFWLIVGCLGFMLIAGTFRRRPGVAVADATMLVILLGIIGLADLILSRFLDTGNTGWTLAAILAFAFAFDALYGLMAPDRQRRRDQKLRSLMRRRRA